ncbi:zinc-dependent peptidase [Aquihabitans sp. G128]|uniref:M90 family metallopeptidase n=1 Tax=Aquihabitans sp. G128 TaxID=2849779 RepID=UPI001C240D26|nr:M90 family metallopeptidase [Aquihabitans sp. G128]QXC61904.1 zinc-dependent peptidase [Aquihabitans sp. G128]
MSWFRRRAALAEDWEQIVERAVAHWAYLDDDERDALAGHIEALVTTKRWEAANGFELTDEIRTVISAQAGLLILGLDLDHYADVGAIIVHPSTMRFRRTSQGSIAGTVVDGDVDLLGEASYQGPVVIAWDSARHSARHPERGHDVVLHEFAHKLDMLDHVVDGTPPLPDAAARQRWVDVCSHELHLLRTGQGGPLLDPYGAADPAEFFAVATEVFFNRPVDVQAHKPELYAVLGAFYRQDPAERVRRRHGATATGAEAGAGADERPS